MSNPLHTLPTEKEIQDSRLLIENYQRKIEGYNTRLNELSSLYDEAIDPAVLADTIRELSFRLETAIKRCAEQDAFITPIRKLPAELLAIILLLHVTEEGHSPWSVLKVCRLWRHIAFGTPLMWNKIHVKIAYWRMSMSALSHVEWSGGSHFIGIGGGIKCKGYEQLEFVLERSGVVPLDIKLETGRDMNITATSTSWSEIMKLLWTQNGHRWRHVEVREQVYSRPLRPGAGWMAPNPSSLPLLESLRIESDYPGAAIKNLLEVVEKTSTKLHTLHISRVRNNILSNLPKLMRQVKHTSWQYTSYSLAEEIWGNSNCSRLESLAVMGSVASPFNFKRTPVPEKYYVQLHTLAMSLAPIEGLKDCAEHLRSLTHVALCNIEITSRSTFTSNSNANTNAEPLQPRSILLPAVTHFTLVSETYRILSYFVLPSLESLELYGRTQTPRQMQTQTQTQTKVQKKMQKKDKDKTNKILDEIWNVDTAGQSPCPSRILHLESLADDVYILSALRFMQDIKQLYFHYESPAGSGFGSGVGFGSGYSFSSQLSSSFAKKPNNRMTKRGEEAIRAWKAPYCPQLEEFTIVYQTASREDVDACMEELRRIQQARHGTASELKRIGVLQTKGKGRGIGRGSENRAHDLLPDFQ